MTTGRSWFRGAAIAGAAAALILVSGGAVAGPKCGGTGGTRTQTFTCRSGELINHVFVEAGLFAARIAFDCMKVNGQAGGKPSGMLGGSKPGFGYNSGNATCQTGQAVWSLETQCGWYVDKVTEIRCGPIQSGKVVQGMANQSINAGGSTGTRTLLQCPKDQGIYKAVVKSGEWLDSIEVFCRKP